MSLTRLSIKEVLEACFTTFMMPTHMRFATRMGWASSILLNSFLMYDGAFKGII